MRKLILGAALLAIAMSCPAETKQALTLHLESGATIVYYLDAEPIIGFKGQAMVVTIDDQSSDIPMQDVSRWEIGMAQYGGVESVATNDKVAVAVYGHDVAVSNPLSSEIYVYDLRGRVVGTVNQREASFTLPCGVYVITVANNSYKIAIR